LPPQVQLGQGLGRNSGSVSLASHAGQHTIFGPSASGGGEGFSGGPQQTHTSIVELGKRLLASARDGDADEVRHLIGRGAPFTTDWLGTSPLHLAAQYGHVQTCVRLLSAGISKDARTKVDKTPLHVAATEGYAEVMEVLIKAGAEVDAVDMVSETVMAVPHMHHILTLPLATHDASSLGGGARQRGGRGGPLAVRGQRGDGEQVRQVADGNRLGQRESGHLRGVAGKKKPLRELVYMANSLSLDQNADTYRQVASFDPSRSDPLTLAATKSISADTDDNSSKEDAMKFLESHGITLLPEDNSSEAPLESLMRNGNQRLALTEAGKLALSASSSGSSSSTRTVTTSSGRPQTVVIKPSASGAGQKVLRRVITTAKPSAASGSKEVKLAGVPGKPAPKVIKLTAAQFAALKAGEPKEAV